MWQQGAPCESSILTACLVHHTLYGSLKIEYDRLCVCARGCGIQLHVLKARPTCSSVIRLLGCYWLACARNGFLTSVQSVCSIKNSVFTAAQNISMFHRFLFLNVFLQLTRRYRPGGIYLSAIVLVYYWRAQLEQVCFLTPAAPAIVCRQQA